MVWVNKAAQEQALHNGNIPPVQSPPGTHIGAAFIGTVIGVLIASNIPPKGRDEAEFRQQFGARMANISFEKLARETYQSLLSSINSFKTASWEAVFDGSDLEQVGLLTKISEDRIMTLEVSLKPPAKTGAPSLLTTIHLWNKAAATPVYSGHFSTSLESEYVNNRNSWVEDEGETLAKALNAGIAQSVKDMLAEEKLIATLGLTSGSIKTAQAFLNTVAPTKKQESVLEQPPVRKGEAAVISATAAPPL